MGGSDQGCGRVRRVEVRLIGCFEVWVDGERVEHFYSNKVRALLAWLSVEGCRPVPRETLCDLLWPRYLRGSARVNLRKALSELRKSLAPSGLLHANRNEVWLEPQAEGWELWSDVAALEEGIGRGELPTLPGRPGAAEGPGSREGGDLGLLAQRIQMRPVCLGLVLEECEGFEVWKEALTQRLVEALRRAAREAPPLAGEPHGGALPHPQTAFFGRSEELGRLCQALRGEGPRWITIAGRAGVGKTRLAQAAADSLGDHFPDGVCWIPVGGLGPGAGSDPRSAAPEIAARRLVSAISTCLGLGPGRRADDVALLTRHLAGRRTLLILDELDALAEEPAAEITIALLGQLLHAAPGLRILATSRVAFQTQVEGVLALEGLPVPEPQRAAADPASAMEAPSVRLFEDRADGGPQRFQVRPDNLLDVLGILRRLEGVPLAIELAARLEGRSSLAELRADLERSPADHGADLLELPERHPGARAAPDRIRLTLPEIARSLALSPGRGQGARLPAVGSAR